MARILLTHPYHLALDPREAALGRPYPPLQTLTAAAVLRRAGHAVQLHDRSFHGDETDFGAVLDTCRGIDAVAIVGDDHSVPMKQCLGRIRRAQQAMAAAAAARGLPVLVSGPDVSDHPQAYLEAGATAAVSGEVLAVLPAWLAGETGVVGLHGAGGAGGRRAPLDDLDALPEAAWDLLDAVPYRRAWLRSTGRWELPVSTARGCPYRCSWCAKPTWGRSYAVRSPERVAAELAHVQDRFHPDGIWFTDDIFGLRPRWLRALREILARQGRPPLPYRCLSRADLLQDEAQVADLAATGCRQVWLGAESGADTVLQAMDKDCSVAEVARATSLLRRHGIGVGFFLQLGHPGEGLAEVQATVDLVGRLRPDEIGVSLSYPLPGTAFYDRVVAQGDAGRWEGSMDNRPLFAAAFGQPFYDLAKKVIQHQHAVARGPQTVRVFLRHPGPRAGRRLAALAWHALRLPVDRRRMVAAAVPTARPE